MSQALSCAVMLTEHDIVCESYESGVSHMLLIQYSRTFYV